MDRRETKDYQFELKLANGKTRKCETSDELFAFAQQNGCHEFESDKDLSQWFEARASRKNK